MRLLSDKEFHDTYCSSMQDISSSPLLVNIWEYADRVIESEYQNCTAWDWEVKHVSETGDGKYHHFAIPVPKDNTYLMVVLDLKSRKFYGHHILDLNEKYGLNET